MQRLIKILGCFSVLFTCITSINLKKNFYVDHFKKSLCFLASRHVGLSSLYRHWEPTPPALENEVLTTGAPRNSLSLFKRLKAIVQLKAHCPFPFPALTKSTYYPKIYICHFYTRLYNYMTIWSVNQPQRLYSVVSVFENFYKWSVLSIFNLFHFYVWHF